VPATAREHRAALFVSYLRSRVRPQDLQAVLAVTGQKIREQLKFPPNRLFMDHQLQVIKDELEAPLKTDQTTHFGMRPPELAFPMEQGACIQWLERTSVCPLFDPAKNMDYLKSHLSADVISSEWLDGFNCKMVGCYECAVNSPSERFGSGAAGRQLKKKMVRLLQRLLCLHGVFDLKTVARRETTASKLVWDQLQFRFLSKHKHKHKHLPVTWTAPIYPRRKTAFLIHILLSVGSFVTEHELMLCGNSRKAFIKAGLFDPTKPKESVNSLLARCILGSLRTAPGSTFRFQ
jgi:hypothetical protein